MSRLSIGGQQLEYAFVGDGPRTLVFLHEGLGSLGLWRDFPARLAAATGSRALVYSRFGYGGSSPVTLPRPLTYMHHEARVVLPALLTALQLTDVTLFGHSDGASIALIYAGSPDIHTARVRSLILEAPHVFAEDLSIASIAKARVAYEQSDLRAKLQRWHGDNVDVAFEGWNRAWLDPGFREWNLEAFLPHITAPTLLLQGKNDEYGTLAQLDAIERQVQGPVTRLELDACGHSPHRDQPEQTLAAAVAFLEREKTEGV